MKKEKEVYTPSCCDTCKYCQLRFIARLQDNRWRCRIMKFKECYDTTGRFATEQFHVDEHVPTWCPLIKDKPTEAQP